MSLLNKLRRKRSVFIACPHCEDAFPAAEAQLFDATKVLPRDASEKLEELKRELAEERADHVEDIRASKERSKIAARVVNIGKVVEKIAPSLRGFPALPSDCRSLFEPIDYVVFRGVSSGRIESLAFVDVKSGRGSLSWRQRAIRVALESGRLSLHLAKVEE